MSKGRVGIVAVGHGELAVSMVQTTRTIIGDCNHMVGVSIKSNDPTTNGRQSIKNAIHRVDNEAGVLLLADMFGGTPSNLCLSFLQPGNIEVISGFNLPMLIKLGGEMKETSFAALVEFIQNYGQKNIVIASKILEGRSSS